MRQGGLKPKSHSSGIYWIRANSGPGGGSNTPDTSFGIFDAILWVIVVPVAVILALPLFIIYEIYRKISGRG